MYKHIILRNDPQPITSHLNYFAQPSILTDPSPYVPRLSPLSDYSLSTTNDLIPGKQYVTFSNLELTYLEQ